MDNERVREICMELPQVAETLTDNFGKESAGRAGEDEAELTGGLRRIFQ